MPYLEHDLAGHSTVTLNREGQTLQFNQATPIPLGFPAIGVRLCDGGAMALVEHGETGVCYIVGVNGLSWFVAPTTGLYTAAWMPDENVAIERADQTGVDVFTVSGTWLRTIPAPYSATGIAYCTPAGEPVMTVDPRCTRTINGIPVFNVSESPDGWLVGLGDGAPGGVIIRVSPQGVMEMCAAQTQLPPRITTGGIACWSGTDAPVTVPSWMPYEAAGPPVIIPPPSGGRLPVAPVMAFPAPCWTGRAEAERASDPANAYWSVPLLGTPSKPVMDTSLYAMQSPGTDYLCGLWLTDSPTKTMALEELDGEIAYTKQRGRWALNIHCDNLTHEAVALAAAKQVRLAGLVPILSSHAFDNPSGFEAQVRRFAAISAWGISRGCRGKSAETMEKADELRRTLAGCQVDFFLNFKTWPGIEPYMDAIANLTTTPPHYPGYVYQPPVPPTGQPTYPPPNADQPVKKRKGWRGTLG